MQQKHNQTQVCFSRWSRKSYAVFASLGKSIKIGVLSIACFCSMLKPQAGFAKTDTTFVPLPDDVVELEEVAITAEKASLFPELTRVVTVVTRTEIERSQAQSLPDLLKSVAGVDIRERGSKGVQADVSLRGGTFDQVIILLNGVNITDPQTGHYNLDLPVDLASVSRIEILEGPGARVQGAGAFSGAINIITESEKTALNAGINAGSYNSFAQQISGSLVTKKWNAFASASHQASRGYKPNTDFDIANAFLQLKYQDTTIGTAAVQAGFNKKDYGANGFYSQKYPNQFEHTETAFASARWAKRWENTGFTPTFFYRRHYDRFELFRDFQNALPFYKSHNYHQTDVGGLTVNTDFYSHIGRTTLGAEYRAEHIFSNTLGDPMAEPKEIKQAPGIFYTKEKLRQAGSVFFSQTFYFGDCSASVGAAVLLSNDFEPQLTYNADLAYLLSQNITLAAAFNKAVRLPTFTDLYYNSSTDIGNPDLQPEESYTVDLGVKANYKQIKLRVGGFYRYADDLIDWVRASDTLPWRSVNLGTIQTWGAEASLAYVFSGNIGKHWKQIDCSYAYVIADKHPTDYYSKYVLDYLKHQFSVHANFDIWKNIGLDLDAVYNHRTGQYADAKSGLPTNYKPYFLMNANLHWTYKIITVYGQVSNILDVKYIDYGNLEQAGRWITAGISIKIER